MNSLKSNIHEIFIHVYVTFYRLIFVVVML